MIEKIINNEKLLSIIIRAEYKSDGIEFFTPDDFSQQLAYMHRKKNYEISIIRIINMFFSICFSSI